LRSVLVLVSLFLVVYCDDQVLTSPSVTDQTQPSPSVNPDQPSTPAGAVDPGHPDGSPTGEVKRKGKDGGKGNPRNKHVESLANTIAKFQLGQNGAGNPSQ